MKISTIKSAEDLSSKSSFEEAFSNIAFAVQSDTNPKLADNILGFQLLEKSDDEKKAVGIIGMQLGRVLVYAPFFFRNGELYGNELMWVVKSDTFVPKSDRWIDYLIGRGSSILGEVVSQEETNKTIQRPDLSMFSRLPVKYGLKLQPWMRDGLAGIIAASMDGGSLDTGINLGEIVKDGSLATALLRLVDAHPRIAVYLNRFHGANLLKQAYKHAVAACSAVGIASKKKRCSKKVTKKCADVKMYTNLDEDDGDLTPKDKLKLMKVGYVIKDKRKEWSKIAEVHQVVEETAKSLSTPVVSGIYDVLMNNGDMVRSMVLRGHAVIYPSNDPKHIAEYSHEIVGTPVDLSPDAIYSKAKPLHTLLAEISHKEGRKYTYPGTENFDCYIGDKYNNWMEATVSAHRLANNRREIESIYIRLPVNQPAYGKPEPPVPITVSANSKKGIPVELTDAVDKITIINNSYALIPRDVRGLRKTCYSYETTSIKPSGSATLAVSKDFKLLPRRNKPVNPDVESKTLPDEPSEFVENAAKASNGDNKQTKSAADIKIVTMMSNDTDACINGKWMSKKAALFHLVADHGLKEQDAIAALKRCYKERKDFFIKYAQPIAGTAPPMPMPPPPVATPGAFGANVPGTYNEVTEFTPGSAYLSAPMQPMWESLNKGGPDPKLIAAVTQAARTGQSEVFDTSVLSAMLSDVEMFDILDKHLPSLIKGLDAIGRLLFNIYWHYDEFSTRLGKYDVSKVRDTLQTIFKRLGDAVLILKEREMVGNVSSVGELLEQEKSKGM